MSASELMDKNVLPDVFEIANYLGKIY